MKNTCLNRQLGSILDMKKNIYFFNNLTMGEMQIVIFTNIIHETISTEMSHSIDKWLAMPPSGQV